MIVTAGKTNKSVYYYIVGDAGHASPGEPVTGLLFSDIETGGSASYARQGAARVDLTLKTLASASAAHDDGGFILVDDTNMPGVYRCDYPDAVFATGVDQAILSIVIAAANNAVAAPIMVDITDVDLRDSVRGGMTALPNAAADAGGGLPISDAGNLDLDTKLANTNEVTAARMAVLTDWIDGGRLDILLDAIPTTAMRGTDSAALASVCTEARLAELGATNLPADIDTLLTRITAAVALASSLTTHDTDIKALLPAALVGGRMDSSVGAMAANVLTAAAIATDAITAAKIASDAITAAKIANDAITADKIATDAIAAAKIATDAIQEIADGILDRTDGVEPASAGTERTVREALRLILSGVAAKASGLATTTATYRDTNDSKDRIVATVDADGNRTAVTLNDT